MSDQESVQPLPSQEPKAIPSVPLPVLPYAQANTLRPGILQATGIMSIVIGGMGVLLGLCGAARSVIPFIVSRTMAGLSRSCRDCDAPGARACLLYVPGGTACY